MLKVNIFPCKGLSPKSPYKRNPPRPKHIVPPIAKRPIPAPWVSITKSISAASINTIANQFTGNCPIPTKANAVASKPTNPPTKIPGLTNSIVKAMLPIVRSIKVILGSPTASRNYSFQLRLPSYKFIDAVLIVLDPDLVSTVSPSRIASN